MEHRSYDPAMPRRGDNTRNQILDAAEQLYSSLGVANVSLRQIRIESKQRNDSAVQYHFGDRDGIIRALAERHLPNLSDIATHVVDRPGARRSRRLLVEALVRPWAEYVTRGASERAFVKIVAELAADPSLTFDTIRDNSLPELETIGIALFDSLTPKMSKELAGERVWTISRFAMQAAADRARLIDSRNTARLLVSNSIFIDNLIAMAVGAINAGASPAT
jgi:AcrR family transcriptional regulator